MNTCMRERVKLFDHMYRQSPGKHPSEVRPARRSACHIARASPLHFTRHTQPPPAVTRMREARREKKARLLQPFFLVVGSGPAAACRSTSQSSAGHSTPSSKPALHLLLLKDKRRTPKLLELALELKESTLQCGANEASDVCRSGIFIGAMQSAEPWLVVIDGVQMPSDKRTLL
mmetsp:Transcript_81703/g.141584  ORF Transcript_81703/g.141584 Transcript_81703/m.141584 type:complete len:174 (+) Transcript_81703:1-522(+)